MLGDHVADICNQEGCYADAVRLSGCGQQDLACQCRSPNFAGIGLAGGPCFLAQCSFNDLSSLSSALTAACDSATVATTAAAATTAPSTVAATVTASPTSLSSSSPSSSSSGASTAPTSTARRVNTATASGEVIAAVPTPSTGEVQVVPDNGMMAAPSSSGSGQGGQTLNAAAITGIVVSGGAVGLVGGILLYFFTVVRRRKMDQAHWDSLEREKAAMQKSLDELKLAVQRSGTFDSLDDEKGGGGGGGGGGEKKRPRTINLTGSKGPGELGVPSRIFELPASPAKLEKI